MLDMKKASKQILRNIFLIIIFTSVIIGCAFYFYQARTFEENSIHWIPFEIETPDKFLIYNSKCRIPDLHPWNRDALAFYKKKKYKSCTKEPLLTTISKINDDTFLMLNTAAEKRYTDSKVSCCYSNITRDLDDHSKPDNHIKVSPCKKFESRVKLTNEAIAVKCNRDDNHTKEIYSNTHAVTFITDELKKRKRKFGEAKPPSILLIGIDSISRLNFIRTLPTTFNYLKRKNWISYKAYNKIGLNTFPNLMAILTGRSMKSIKNFANPKSNFLDIYGMIWKVMKDLGYVTAYAEDLSKMNTFTFNKKGFNKKPTDFYFRSYTIATEKLDVSKLYSLIYCAGPESYGERILNLVRDFTETFAAQPSFGFFWMNSFSHDNINIPTRMDEKLEKFLRDLEKKGVMKRTIIIFLSDHGMRFGKVRITPTGWLEERLPFLHFWIPDSFRKAHKKEYEHLRKNSERLTTPYDLHMTLQHILTLSGLKYRMKQSLSCPKCKSLFTEIKKVRSCEDAGIDFDDCTCISYKYFDPSSPLVMEVAKFVLNEVRKYVSGESEDTSKCAKLRVHKIIHARISNTGYDWYKNNTYLLIMFETYPKIVLEAIVKLKNGDAKENFRLLGEVRRLNFYKSSGWCVESEHLKKYCYCRWKISFHFTALLDWFNAINMDFANLLKDILTYFFGSRILN